MITRTKRLLAAIDRFIGWDQKIIIGNQEIVDFYMFFGRRMAIVDKNNRLCYLGYSWNVVHEYKNDKLISRERRPNTVGKDERVILGRSKVNKYLETSEPYPCTSEVCGLEI